MAATIENLEICFADFDQQMLGTGVSPPVPPAV